MKRISPLAAILLGALLSACGDRSPAPPEAPVETAGDAMRRDNLAIAERLAVQKADADAQFEAERARLERLQFADSLGALGKRAGEAMDEVGRVTLREMPGPGKKLETVKAEAEILAVNDCTGPLRTALLASIATTLDAIEQYKREKGIASVATREKLQTALQQFDDYDRQLARCR